MTRRTLSWTVLAASAVLVALWCLRPRGGEAPAAGAEPTAAAAPVRESPPPRTVAPDVEAQRVPVAVAETPAPPAQPLQTRLRVQGEDAAAIADAEVFASHGDAFALAGRTDADGTLSLPSAGLGGAELVVRHAEFETARLAVAAQAPRELVVTLGPGCTLRGIVSIQESGVPVEGVRVVATRRKRVPSCRDLEAPGVDNLRVDQATSDAFGRFEIDGLDPDATWNLHAAGAGFIGAEVADLRCGAASVELLVLPLYGVHVAFSGPDGAPIAVDPDVFQSYGMTVEVLDSTVIDMNSRTVEGALAGITADCAGLRRENGTFLYATHDEREFVGRIAATFELPGYERVKALLHAPRVAGAIATQTLALKPLERGLGSLSVEFENLALANPADGEPAGASAYVLLTEAPGRSVELLMRGGPRPRTFAGIPHGEYRAQFFAANGALRLPADLDGIPVTISDEPARVSFDLGRTGALHVELVDSDSRAVAGMATLFLRRTGARGVYFVDFLEAPYDVAALAPGEYEIGGFQGGAFDRFDMRAKRPTVTIVAGEVARLVLADLK